MSNFEQGKFEFDLGATKDTYAPHLVIVASFNYYDRSGGHLYFDFYERGDIGFRMMADKQVAPESLAGAKYERKLASRSFHSADLRELNRSLEFSLIASNIDGIAQHQYVGEAASRMVWTLFWALVLADPEDRVIDSLDNEFLSQTRAEALAQREPAAV